MKHRSTVAFDAGIGAAETEALAIAQGMGLDTVYNIDVYGSEAGDTVIEIERVDEADAYVCLETFAAV